MTSTPLSTGIALTPIKAVSSPLLITNVRSAVDVNAIIKWGIIANQKGDNDESQQEWMRINNNQIWRVKVQLSIILIMKRMFQLKVCE